MRHISRKHKIAVKDEDYLHLQEKFYIQYLGFVSKYMDSNPDFEDEFVFHNHCPLKLQKSKLIGAYKKDEDKRRVMKLQKRLNK